MLAIFGVLLCHATENVYSLNLDYISSISRHSKVFAFSSFTIGRLGVPFFLMISGYLLLDKEYNSKTIIKFWKKNWLHLLLCTWIWFAIYELFLIWFKKKPIDILTILEDMLFVHKVEMTHVWYMPMILGIYILIPMVSIVFKNVDLKILKYPIIIFSCFAFVFPLLNTINNVIRPDVPLANQFSLEYSGGSYGLYIIFGYLVKKGAFKKIKTPIILAISVLAFILGVTLQIWSYFNGVCYNIWYDCAFIMVTSVGLFELFSRLKRIYGYKIVKMISYYSFPIYLIHNIICQMIRGHMNDLLVSHFVKVILMWIISFIVSIFIAWLINRIPKVGKFILYTK